MRRAGTITEMSANMLTIGRTLGASRTYMSTTVASSANSGAPRRRRGRTLMGANWSIAVLTATAGRRRNIILTISRYLNASLPHSAARNIVLTFTARRSEDILLLASDCSQETGGPPHLRLRFTLVCSPALCSSPILRGWLKWCHLEKPINLLIPSRTYTVVDLSLFQLLTLNWCWVSSVL